MLTSRLFSLFHWSMVFCYSCAKLAWRNTCKLEIRYISPPPIMFLFYKIKCKTIHFVWVLWDEWGYQIWKGHDFSLNILKSCQHNFKLSCLYPLIHPQITTKYSLYLVSNEIKTFKGSLEHVRDADGYFTPWCFELGYLVSCYIMACIGYLASSDPDIWLSCKFI